MMRNSAKFLKYLKYADAGRSMVEILAVVALILLVTPLIYQKAANYSTEMQDTSIASNMKELRQGLTTYMEIYYPTVSDFAIQHTIGGAVFEPMPDGVDVDYTCIAANDAELSRLIRPENYTSSLFKDVMVSIKREKIGTDKILLNGLIVTTDAKEIDGVRGGRISSLIGSESGFIPTSKDSSSAGDPKFTARGSGGFFTIPTKDYFEGTHNSGCNATNLRRGQIVISASYPPTMPSSGKSQGAVDQYLFRNRTPDLITLGGADINTMQATLNMFGCKDASDQLIACDIIGAGSIRGQDAAIGSSAGQRKFTDASVQSEITNQASSLISGSQAFMGVDFNTNIAILNEIRIGALGGAKLSEVLPKVMLMGVKQNVTVGAVVPTNSSFLNTRVLRVRGDCSSPTGANCNSTTYVNNGCPIGYTLRKDVVQKELPASGIEFIAVSKDAIDNADHKVTYLRSNASGVKTKVGTRYTGTGYTENGPIADLDDAAESEAASSACVGGVIKDSSSPANLYKCTLNNSSNQKIQYCEYNISAGQALSEYYNAGSSALVASYNSAGSLSIKKPTGGIDVINCTSATCTCTNRAYCPGATWDSGANNAQFKNIYSYEYANAGECQAQLKAAIMKDRSLLGAGGFPSTAGGIPFTPGNWYGINVDGTDGSNNIGLANATAAFNQAAHGGIYYNLRLFFRAASSSSPSCGGGGAARGPANFTTSICQHGLLGTNHIVNWPLVDVYYYCYK